MKIRKAKKGDLKSVAEIFRIGSAKKPYLQKWTERIAFKKIKESFKKHDMYVVLVEGKVIGFITSYIEPNHKEKAYVDELWLKSDYQGKGIGQALMRFIEKMYKKKQIKILQLVSEKNSGAFKFYKKLGYSERKSTVFMDKRLRES